MLESNNSNILDGSDMGTGSDYGGLMQHIGVACLDLRVFGASDDGYSGIYHTLYDDYRYMSVMADPHDFVWHKTVAGVWGSLALRLADSDILPLSYVEYVAYMNSTMQTLQTRDVNGSYTPAFASIYASMSVLTSRAVALDSLVVDAGVRASLTDGSPRAALQLRQLNDQLFLSERCLMYWQGIPGREWYRHVVCTCQLHHEHAHSRDGRMHQPAMSDDAAFAHKLCASACALCECMRVFAGVDDLSESNTTCACL